MNNGIVRSLTVLADGEQVTGFRHACLTGREALGPEPLPYLLRMLNLADAGYAQLAAAKTVAVLREDRLLARGQVSVVYRRTVREGTLTEAVFSPGLALWEAPVSLSVEAGVTVSETVRRILEASGTGIRLLPFAGPDPVFARGQAFWGRAAECVSEALSAAHARMWLTEAGLCVVPAEKTPVSLVLTETDLTGMPAFAGGRMILRTAPAGWPLGKRMEVKWKNGSAEGLVSERYTEADNLTGNWFTELLAETEAPL